MHQKKLENLLALVPEERYEYFIRTVVQFEEVWALNNEEGYITFVDKEGDVIFPVWPHKELALKCRFKEHLEIGAVPQKIEIHAFLEYCIPDMIDAKVLFGVFYDDKRSSLVVNGVQLLDEIESEYEEIWGEEE